MKIIKPYWHHTSQTSHSKLFKNYFPFFFNLFFPIYYFSVLCFVTASLPYLFTYFPFFLFPCFILLFIDFNSPNVWDILKDTSCLLLVFFFFQIGFSEITKTCTHVHRLPLKRLTRLKKKVIQSWREFYIRFPAANPSCQTL